MTLIPGICFCAAPGIPGSSKVRYCLDATGFLTADSGNRFEVFWLPAARTLGGARKLGADNASVDCTGSSARIDFFLQAPAIGRFLASPDRMARISGTVVYENDFGGPANQERFGNGRYMLVNHAVAERILQTLGAGGVPAFGPQQWGSEWAQVIDKVRGSNSNIGNWLGHLAHALRGGMNQVVVGYLLFSR